MNWFFLANDEKDIANLQDMNCKSKTFVKLKFLILNVMQKYVKLTILAQVIRHGN